MHSIENDNFVKGMTFFVLFVLFCLYIIVFPAPHHLQLSFPVQEQREGDGEERLREHTRPIQREEGREGAEREEES